MPRTKTWARRMTAAATMRIARIARAACATGAGSNVQSVPVGRWTVTSAERRIELGMAIAYSTRGADGACRRPADMTRPLGRGAEGRGNCLRVAGWRRRLCLRSKPRRRRCGRDESGHFASVVHQFRHAAGRDPVARGSHLERGHDRGALVEDRHRNRIYRGFVLAEGGGETALADAGQLLEEQIHSNDGVRRIRRESDLGQADDFALGLSGQQDLARAVA